MDKFVAVEAIVRQKPTVPGDYDCYEARIEFDDGTYLCSEGETPQEALMRLALYWSDMRGTRRK